MAGLEHQEVVDLADAMRDGVGVRTHVFLLKPCHDTFTGADAVKWILNNAPCAENLQDGIEIADRMLQIGVIESVFGSKEAEVEGDIPPDSKLPKLKSSKSSKLGLGAGVLTSAYTPTFRNSGHSLYRFSAKLDSEQPIDVSKLDDVSIDFERCLPTTTRKYRLKSYDNVFVGSEAVDFLVNRGHAKNRKHAVRMGDALRIRGVFRHVCDEHTFKDGFFFYTFEPAS